MRDTEKWKELPAEGNHEGNFKRMGKATWVPPHMPMTSYTVNMLKPYVDGRMFFRGKFHLYCYDMRQTGESSTVGGYRDAKQAQARATASFAVVSVSDGRLRYRLRRAGRVWAEQLDIRGRTIAAPVDAHQEAGDYEIAFPRHAPGCVMVRLTVDGISAFRGRLARVR